MAPGRWRRRRRKEEEEEEEKRYFGSKRLEEWYGIEHIRMEWSIME